jgi:hypothetical protein
MRRLILAAFLLAGLAGCASNLSSEQRNSIRRVSIADVKMPDKPTVIGGPMAVPALLGGPLGAALLQAASDLPTLYVQQLQKNGVDVAALFKADISQQLRLRGFQVVPHGDPVDAVFVPQVMQYGLVAVDLTSTTRIPLLVVRVDLNKSSNGERLWRGDVASNGEIDVNKQLAAKPIDEYMQNGELLRQEIRKTSRLIAGVTMAKL